MSTPQVKTSHVKTFADFFQSYKVFCKIACCLVLEPVQSVEVLGLVSLCGLGREREVTGEVIGVIAEEGTGVDRVYERRHTAHTGQGRAAGLMQGPVGFGAGYPGVLQEAPVSRVGHALRHVLGSDYLYIHT